MNTYAVDNNTLLELSDRGTASFPSPGTHSHFLPPQPDVVRSTQQQQQQRTTIRQSLTTEESGEVFVTY